jgi:hypothetical protein
MDTISHILWAYAFTMRKTKFLLIAFFGMLPDLVPFSAPLFSSIFLGGKYWNNVSELSSTIRFLYNISHSLFICLLVFLLIFAIRKKIYIWIIGWPLHILMDIPTHEKEFHATQFLYPISSFTIDGIRWTNEYIFIGNWILIFLVYTYIFRNEIKKVIFFKKQIKNKYKGQK